MAEITKIRSGKHLVAVKVAGAMVAKSKIIQWLNEVKH